MFSNIISYLNVRIPVQMYSALWILVATRTLKMIHTNAYVYQDPVETTATSVCFNNLRICSFPHDQVQKY